LNVKRLHYPLEVMLVCVRWYAAYPLRCHHFDQNLPQLLRPLDTAPLALPALQ
jgi:hypothetical protein